MAKKSKKHIKKSKSPRKRKVLGPKKRKSRSKARPKGVLYIAQRLKKYFPKRYPTVKSAYPKAKEILSQLQAEGKPVTVVNIFELTRKHRQKGPAGAPPYINPAMLDPHSFFEGQVLESDYPKWISEASKDIEFRSMISPAEFSIFPGGSEVSYETHFKPFVDYSNKMLNLMREQGQIPETDDASMIITEYPMQDLVKGPKKDRKTGQWYCEIVTCDLFGERQNYGFNPNEPTTGPKEVVTPSTDASVIRQAPEITPETPKITPTTKEVTPGVQKDFEIEKLRLQSQENIKKAEIESLERVKTKKISELKELLKDKIIDFDQYLRAIKEI